ncbi:DUF2332 domain-containing protein [Citricoccus nitrophenolicus]|uniref:DUF2332 domain-containing protein n=1 Tax=Citricoccus nitrophenolicus TaxID=863575 RepID=A0ABV0IK92_9MICC
MDPAIHRGQLSPSEVYRRFARTEAHGSSKVYEDWAENIAEDPAVLDLLASLPRPKRQPNLVFAAARIHGAEGSYASFRGTLLGRWNAIRPTILARSTQTNEAARCAVLLPFLAALPQPLALIEVGASAGLCLLPDRYSYRYTAGQNAPRYDAGPRLDPAAGPSGVVIECGTGPGITVPDALPRVAWRAGIDLAPVDVRDPAATDWLEALIWPEHHERRDRLRAALDIARRDPPRVVAGDLNQALPALAAEAPADATLVVFHTAVLAYLEAGARADFVDLVRGLPGHWISNEGRGVVPLPSPGARPADTEGATQDGRFVVAVDGVPRALADPHGRCVVGLPAS